MCVNGEAKIVKRRGAKRGNTQLMKEEEACELFCSLMYAVLRSRHSLNEICRFFVVVPYS